MYRKVKLVLGDGSELEFDSLTSVSLYLKVDSRRVGEWIRGKLCRLTKPLSAKYKISYIDSYDKAYFDVWSPKMAYFLGLLYADGNIRKTKIEGKKGYRCYLSIGLIDRDIIEFLKKELKATHKICSSFDDKERKTVYSLTIGGDDIYNQFKRLGFDDNKTLKDCSIKVNPEFEDYFWAGYIDGDGCVTYDKSSRGVYTRIHIDFCEKNQIMISRFERWLVSKGISIHKRSIFREDLGATVNIVEFRVQSKIDLDKLLESTYFKSELHINRKYNKLLNLIRNDSRY